MKNVFLWSLESQKIQDFSRNLKTPYNIFQQWLQKWDRELIAKQRKIALSPAHPQIGLQNIKLILLPPNVTSLIQPSNQCIIQALKQHYHRLILMKLFVIIEASNNDIVVLRYWCLF